MVPGYCRIRPLSSRLLETLVVRLGRLGREVLVELPFDHAGRLIGEAVCVAGGVASIGSSYRMLVQRALACDAAGIVLAHNHPSGSHRPSRADVVATRQIAAVCRAVDLDLFDHLVIGGRSVASMRQAGLLAGAG
ncbi:JAB domain-containing protein [Novosphingobium sp. KA1]|uniref:JAB domain-containing protein n=1 Tax=Novosphingobium sp. (strain KA1) TaxID=164608 RepID=UPI001F5CFFB9|nr:JAB domain-containing protein [Novosphingobium sp. KA1]